MPYEIQQMQNQNQKAAQAQQRTRLRYHAKDAFVDDGGMPPKISQGAGATAEADHDDRHHNDAADRRGGGGGALLFVTCFSPLLCSLWL